MAEGPTSSPLTAHDGTLVEELTGRELSTLRAKEGELSLREFAGELYLSLNTVEGYAMSPG